MKVGKRCIRVVYKRLVIAAFTRPSVGYEC
jgi:hypothetical protein